MYKQSEIISRYKFEQFEQIPKTKLHEFAGPITTSAKDKGILDTWERHFKSVKVPYIVIKRLYCNFKGRNIMAKFMVTERRA